jgi:hypothetical protein
MLDFANRFLENKSPFISAEIKRVTMVKDLDRDRLKRDRFD